MTAKKRILKCGGSFNKKDDCGVEFFYALREDVDNNHNSVTVLYAVDKSGCPIEDGNLIVLPHNGNDDILLCNDINKCLDLSLDDQSVLSHGECCDDNTYIG